MKVKTFLYVRKILGIFTCLTKVTYLENFLAFGIVLYIDHLYYACDSRENAKNIDKLCELVYYVIVLI